MPRVIFSLEEQFSDLRSNDIAFKFMIENQGANAIDLQTITPRIPEKVELVEVRDTSLVAVKARHDELNSELTQLLRDSMEVSLEEVRNMRAQARADMINKMTEGISGFLGVYARMMKTGFSKSARREVQYELSNPALSLKIEDKSQAKVAFDRFIDTEDVGHAAKEIFKTKMEQLATLEEQMASGTKSSSLATIEPDSFFARTYIIKFPRNSFTPQKYNISVEGSYSEQGGDKLHIGGTTTSLVISPNPFILTLIAVCSSSLGVLLRVAVASSLTSQSPNTFWAGVGDAFTGSPIVSAVILALIFFNLYEFTELGKRFTMGVGWRSALLIGSLCGLFGEQVLGAIKSFVVFT